MNPTYKASEMQPSQSAFSVWIDLAPTAKADISHFLSQKVSYMDINIIYETKLCDTILLVKQKINHHKIFYDHTVAAIVELAPIGVAVFFGVPHRKIFYGDLFFA